MLFGKNKMSKSLLISRMKKLNRASMIKLKAHKKERGLYKFLTYMLPVPRQMKINDKIILYHPIKRYFFIPDKFYNDFWEGRVVLHGLALNKNDFKTNYSEAPTIEDLKVMELYSQEEVDSILKNAEDNMIKHFRFTVASFSSDKSWGKL
jgi:hypothetical protein